MRITNMVPDIEYGEQQSQQSLATALQQLSTGLRVNQPSDDPAAAAQDVESLAASANVDQYSSNVSAVTAQLQTADDAISTITTSLNSAISLATSGATGNVSSANLQALASQAQGILTDVIGQANSAYTGSYVFAGSASSTPPFVAASTSYTSQNGSSSSPLTTSFALEAGSVTTVSDAGTGQTFTYKAGASDTVGDLESAISAAVSAGTLSSGTSASINSNGELAITSATGVVVSSNDSALGAMNATAGAELSDAYAYVGNGTVNNVQIDDAEYVPTNVPGNQLFMSGANVIGSLTNLVNALKTGSSESISTALSGISSAINYLSAQRVPLDNTISQLGDQDTFLNQETLTLTTAQTALVGADIATAATNLSQAELDNSAVLSAAARVLPETLFSYLGPA